MNDNEIVLRFEVFVEIPKFTFKLLANIISKTFSLAVVV